MALLPFNDDSSGFQQIVRKRGPADSRRDEERRLRFVSRQKFDGFFSYFTLLSRSGKISPSQNNALTSTRSRVFV